MAKTRGWRRGPRDLLVSLALVGGLIAAGCGGSGSQASVSSTGGTSTAASAPAVSPSGLSVPSWDAPGSATSTQALAVTRRYATALHAERIPKADLYVRDAAWDHWGSGGSHATGASVIEHIYRDAAPYLDWSRAVHLMAAPGVGVCEGVATNLVGSVITPPRTPYVVLLAVDGGRISREEIFTDTRSLPPRKPPVEFWGTAPGPRDTVRAAAAVGAAVGDAFANGDSAALRAVVSPDVLFYDTAQAHGRRGWNALLHWWANVPDVELRNAEPIAGAGWVVDLWTVRQILTTGQERNMPGATVMEVRGGKVVRMTLYYESREIPLQLRTGEEVGQ